MLLSSSFRVWYSHFANDRMIYYRYIERIINVAAAKARELSQRLSDRLSDAGRKMSDRMVSEKKVSVSG